MHAGQSVQASKDAPQTKEEAVDSLTKASTLILEGLMKRASGHELDSVEGSGCMPSLHQRLCTPQQEVSKCSGAVLECSWFMAEGRA